MARDHVAGYAGTGPRRCERLALVAHLVLGLLTVLASAWLFTNGLEWFGLRLGLSHGALGSVFAALGTALPEASIAVLAAVAPGPAGGGGTGQAVSIGAVLGAPMLLATLGLAVLGVGCFRAGRAALQVRAATVRRDLLFFLGTYATVTASGLIGLPTPARFVVAGGLVVAYGWFVARTLSADGGQESQGEPPGRLLLAPRWVSGDRPPFWGLIAVQLMVALAVMYVGAQLFVHTLTDLSTSVGLSGFVLAALIAPLATELPETANSLVWIAQGKDALATGNVTGALVLQGAVIPAVGLVFTPWHFDLVEAVAALVALGGGLAVYVALVAARRLNRWSLLVVGVLYIAFVIWVL